MPLILEELLAGLPDLRELARVLMRLLAALARFDMPQKVGPPHRNG